jgi:hypothetical protein
LDLIPLFNEVCFWGKGLAERHDRGDEGSGYEKQRGRNGRKIETLRSRSGFAAKVLNVGLTPLFLEIMVMALLIVPLLKPLRLLQILAQSLWRYPIRLRTCHVEPVF